MLCFCTYYFLFFKLFCGFNFDVFSRICIVVSWRKSCANYTFPSLKAKPELDKDSSLFIMLVCISILYLKYFWRIQQYSMEFVRGRGHANCVIFDRRNLFIIRIIGFVKTKYFHLDFIVRAINIPKMINSSTVQTKQEGLSRRCFFPCPC